MPETTGTSVNLSRLITKKEAADRLSISTRTLDRMVARNLIEKVFLMGSVRFRSRDLEEIIMKGT